MGRLEQIIRGPSGASIPNATVVATNVATAKGTCAFTTSAGHYVILNLVPRDDSVSGKKTSFVETTTGIVIRLGQIAEIDSSLEIAPGTQTILVRGQLR